MAGKELDFGTENWNVADGYVKFKVLLPMMECDRYKNIAQFGTDNVLDAPQIDPNYKSIMRLEALERFLQTIRKLVTNTKSLIKGKGSKEKYVEIKKELEDAAEVIPLLRSVTEDQRTGNSTIRIKEEYFIQFLSNLTIVEENIIEILNKEGLIFPKSEEFDLSRITDSFKQGF